MSSYFHTCTCRFTWPIPSKSWNRWLFTKGRRHNSTSRWVIHNYGYMTYIEYGRESWNSWLFTRRRRRRWHNRASRWLIHRSGHLKSLHALKPSVLRAPFYTQPPSSRVEIALCPISCLSSCLDVMIIHSNIPLSVVFIGSILKGFYQLTWNGDSCEVRPF